MATIALEDWKPESQEQQVLLEKSLAERSGYYVYKLTDPASGKFYIGVRQGWIGDGYSGSGNWCFQMKRKGVFLVKEIIKLFPDRKQAIGHERHLIIEQSNNELCMNIALLGCVPKNENTIKSLNRNLKLIRGNAICALARIKNDEYTAKKLKKIVREMTQLIERELP